MLSARLCYNMKLKIFFFVTKLNRVWSRTIWFDIRLNLFFQKDTPQNESLILCVGWNNNSYIKPLDMLDNIEDIYLVSFSN